MDPIQYSNFGDRVDVFAPTNIPVMSYPNGTGTVAPQIYGGTSASAPYVAGVAAMIKALDPSLDSDRVGAILRETARPGVGNATRVVDALAAVRRAAQPFPIVSDRHEPNNFEATTNLGSAPSYAENNLNLDGKDRDRFRFNVPGGSIATISLRYASGLGTVSLASLDGGACAAPALSSDTARADGTGRTLVYRLAGGPHVLETRADAIVAYNLGITFALPMIAPDPYEVNDLVSQATFRYSFTSGNSGGIVTDIGPILRLISPRFTIDATVHHPADVDHYIVRGEDLTGKEFELTGTAIRFNTPAVMLYGNDSRVDLQVFELNPDNTAGALVKHLVADSCTPEALVVPVKSNAYYLVRVAGAPGRYTLQNGIDVTSRRHPIEVRDRIYEALHPGEPIEHVLRYRQYYLLPADREFEALSTDDPRIHVRLLDASGEVLRHGAPNGAGESLSFAGLPADRARLLAVDRRDRLEEEPILRLAWRAAAPSRTSGNLVRNGGAETLGSGTGSIFPGWTEINGVAPARPMSYRDETGEGTFLSQRRVGEHPGGVRLFAGAHDSDRSGVRQVVPIAADWQESIEQGHVKVQLSALLGGQGRDQDFAKATIRYLDARQYELGELVLPSVGAHERSSETALVTSSANEYLPPGTAFIVVDLEFHRVEGGTNEAFADNVELTLEDFSKHKRY